MRKLVPLTAVVIVLGFAGNGWGQHPARHHPPQRQRNPLHQHPLHRIQSRRLPAKRKSERRKSTKLRGCSPTTICPRRGEFRR